MEKGFVIPSKTLANKHKTQSSAKGLQIPSPYFAQCTLQY